MTLNDMLKDVRFAIDTDGRSVATIVDIATWQRIVDLLEASEDQGIVSAYLYRCKNTQYPEQIDLVSWEQASAELGMAE